MLDPIRNHPGLRDNYLPRDAAIFPARLTGVAVDGTDGIRYYDWVEQQFNPATGVYATQEPARRGTGSTTPRISPATEVTGTIVSVISTPLVWMRPKGMVSGQIAYEFLAPSTPTDPFSGLHLFAGSQNFVSPVVTFTGGFVNFQAAAFNTDGWWDSATPYQITLPGDNATGTLYQITSLVQWNNAGAAPAYNPIATAITGLYGGNPVIASKVESSVGVVNPFLGAGSNWWIQQLDVPVWVPPASSFNASISPLSFGLRLTPTPVAGVPGIANVVLTVTRSSPQSGIPGTILGGTVYWPPLG